MGITGGQVEDRAVLEEVAVSSSRFSVLGAIGKDWRRRMAAVAALAGVAALIAAWLTPRGPVTTFEALASMVAALAIGVAAGVVLGNRWSIIVAPAAFAVVFELGRMGVEGPTVDRIELGGIYGIIALVVGRVFHGLLVLVPMMLGAVYGVWWAGRTGRAEVTIGGFGWTVTGLLTVSIGAVAILLALPASTAPVVGADGEPLPGSIAEMVTVEIGGHPQTMLIRGRSIDNPVLLYLAGGPGGTDLGAIRRDVTLEQDFTVVAWDQRGAGKSYAALDPTETFTPDQMVADTVEVTNYLRARFDVDRIYLVGQSWGSTLGVLAAQQRPELYEAFVGVGQMVSQRETDQMFWEDTLAWAEGSGNVALAETMRSNGPPPYTNLIEYDPVIAYEHEWNAYPEFDPSTEMPAILFVPEYTWMDRMNAFRGFLDTAGVLYPQLQDIDFRDDVAALEVPTYVVMGEHEARGRAVLAEEWFEMLDAPGKEMIVIPGGGHRAHFDAPVMFADIMRRVRDATSTGETVGNSALEDGEHFVFVSGVTSITMTVDPAEFLTGTVAVTAARADGEIGSDEELPNGFYVRNLEATVFEVPLGDAFEVTLIEGATVQPGSPLDAPGLARLFAGETTSDPFYGFTPDALPMTITVKDGHVIRASQQYLP